MRAERRCYSGASESACLKCCASVTMLTGIEPSGAYVKLTWCPPCFGADRDPTFSATCPVTSPDRAFLWRPAGKFVCVRDSAET